MVTVGDTGSSIYLFPTSFAQRRLWFLDRITQNSDLYAVNLTLRADRAIDPAGLRIALATVVERHEILRTTFVAVDGEPLQRISPGSDTAIESVPDAGEFLRRPFDLEHGPLLRVGITPDGTVLIRMHHIVTDGWSAEVFLAEIRELYRAWESGREPNLPELPIQYADFALWQRERLSGAPLDVLRQFWRTELASAPTLSLTTDRPRPATATFRGGSVRFEIRSATVAALRAVAHQERATMFMVTLAAFSTVLARYSAQDDVLVGTPVAGRDRHEVENLIGFFVNTVVIRCELAGNPTFRDMVRRVRERSVAAFAHQDLPFERLVEEIATTRDASRNPLVQVLFQLVTRAGGLTATLDGDAGSRDGPAAGPGTGGTGFGFSAAGTDRETSKFDLSLTMWEVAGGLAGRLEYARDLFDHRTAQRISAHLGDAFGQLAEHPDVPLSQIHYSPDPDPRSGLGRDTGSGTPEPSERPDTSAGRPADRTVLDLILDQAARTPAAPAVGDLDYRELIRSAAGLAHALRDRGAGPGAIVGIALPRGDSAVVAILGTWLSGAAFLPLDVDDPPARRREILDDARPIVVIDAAFRFPPGGDDSPAERPRPHDLAYLLYTSGSSGPGKGVSIEHRSLANFIGWFARLFPDPLPWVTRLTFDASLKQVLTPLVVGGRVWAPGAEAVMDPGALVAELAGRTGSTLNCVPAQWAACLDAIEAGRAVLPPESLRTLVLGGEDPPAPLIARTFRAFPGLAVWNGYGPTETTSLACAGRLHADTRITVGSPIDGVRLLVIDVLGTPAPPGVPGELWIGGPGVARGYHRRPDLTAERFVLRDGERYYRTGDLVVARAEGLQFLGRLDDQINLAGVRLEPSEVERHLLAFPGVRDAAVAARQGRIVGYVVGDVPLGDLRAHLRDRLPAPIVPSRIVPLPALPRTARGKIDRRALPDPPAATGSGRTPLGPLERNIASVWQEVLGVDRVGAHDNFFDLGGHSLLLVRVHQRLLERIGVPLSILELFQRPTVNALATHLSRS